MLIKNRRNSGLVLFHLLLPILMVMIIFALAFACWFLYMAAGVGAAYGAKRIASEVFVAGRDAKSVVSQELAFLPLLKYSVDTDARMVTARVLGRRPKTAVYRDGLGVAIAHDGNIGALQQQGRPGLLRMENLHADLPWPMGDAPSGNPHPSNIREKRLSAALDHMFDEPEGSRKHRTRAVVVVYKGEIIAERYADGFGPDQRFLGWSLAKGVVHALYGIAVHQGKLSTDDLAPFWQDEHDPRSAITIDMLMRMTSGLAWDEYSVLPLSDLVISLLLQPSAAAYAADLPLAYPTDTVWRYSSGATNMLSEVLRQVYGDDAYYRLPYEKLFAKLGMRNAVIEADAAGVYIGSSFLYATARDYARLGLLYARDGVWQDTRILPKGWVKYGRTPTLRKSYGAHWWLPSVSARNDAEERGTPLPKDFFYGMGFEGQTLSIIPSRDLVVVRLGLAHFRSIQPFDYIYDILDALPE